MSAGIRKSKKGSMPFAIIAVTLLLLGGTYVSVCAYIENDRDNINNITNEISSIDAFADELSGIVSRGTGEIVADISKDDLGSLLSRHDEFERRMSSWIEFIFPISNGVVTARLNDHDVNLTSEVLRIASDEGTVSRPTYLIASGTIDVSLRSESGSSSRTIDICTDGTSSLPFLMESMSLFEISASDGSVLQNMISYQLTSLAQYRVLQGYGSKNVHGDRGTDSIITKDDVLNAFDNAMAALEMLNFRTTSDGTEFGDKVDLAAMLASKNGTLEIDVSAIYAQALAAMIDDLVIKWLDYFMLGEILDTLDWFADKVNEINGRLREGVNKILNFFGKNIEKDTAGTYIRDLMKGSKSESEYRYLEGDVIFETEAREYVLGETTFTMPSVEIRMGFPGSDVVKWRGWDSFLDDYKKGNNALKEKLKGILNWMCVELMSNKNGTLKIELNTEKNMFDQITDALSEFLKGHGDLMESIAGSAASESMYDPMFASMYGMMVNNRNEIFKVNEFKMNMENAIRENVTAKMADEFGGMVLDTQLLEMIVSDMMSSHDVSNALNQYGNAVDERLDMFGDELNSVRIKDSSGSALIKTLTKGLVRFDLVPPLDDTIMKLCTEMAEHISLNPSSGVFEMPTDRNFIVSDDSGKHSESVSLIRHEDIEVDVMPPSKNDRNVHNTDIPWDSTESAAYSAIFTVSLKGNVSYDATSRSALSSMLGVSDARCSGSVDMDAEMNIPVLSGWALMGVDYKASNTIVDDAKRLFLKAIEPLIGPLLKMYSMIREIAEMIGSAMFEVSFHAAMFVTKVYSVVYDAMDRIYAVIESIMDKISAELGLILELGLSKQKFGFSYRDMSIAVNMNIKDMMVKKKTVLKLEISAPVKGVTTTAGLEIKKSDKGEYSFAGSAKLKSDTWDVNVTVDPFMKVRKHLLEIGGTVRDTDIQIMIPELVQYDMLEFRLSDLPAVGKMLSNIPLPIPGMKGDLDAGVQLKYNMPYKHGLVINEFESNPPGTDTGKEWLELYNSSPQTIDLDGYKIMAASSEKMHDLTGTISHGERKVITFPKQFLRNGAGDNGNGEKVILFDPDENEVDSTPWKADNKNDDQTWQRSYDGATTWEMKKATKDKPNGGQIINGNAIKAMIQNCLTDSLLETFDEVGKVTTVEGVSTIFEKTIERTIGKIIDTIASSVTEASVFVEIAVTDYTGTVHSGVRLSLTVDGDLVRDGLNWMVGQVRSMMQNIDNPSGLSPKTILSDDIWIKLTVYGEVTAPEILFKSYDKKLSVGVVTKCNISSVCTLLGKEIGTWKVGMGVVFENIPSAAVPKMMKVNNEKSADLWLIQGTFGRSKG